MRLQLDDMEAEECGEKRAEECINRLNFLLIIEKPFENLECSAEDESFQK